MKSDTSFHTCTFGLIVDIFGAGTTTGFFTWADVFLPSFDTTDASHPTVFAHDAELSVDDNGAFGFQDSTAFTSETRFPVNVSKSDMNPDVA